MVQLENKIVVVTGAGTGIGEATARAFVDAGARTVFVGRRLEKLEEAARGVDTGRVMLRACDVSDRAAVDALGAEVATVWGGVDILVNNAGTNTNPRAVGAVDPDDWDHTIAINLTGVFLGCKAGVPALKRAGGGSIINTTSISYMMGNAGYPAYTTANSGINGMTRSLAREFGPDKIRVNALAPGWVLTEKQLEMWTTPEALDAHMERMCLKEHLKPEDIVGPILFLASRVSGAMTGQAMVVDGGVVVTG